MRPSLPVIAFIVLAGAGYGLWIWLGLALGMAVYVRGTNMLLVPLTIGFMLVSGGLLASALHLGKRGRAWHGFPAWRSSWLSHQVLAAIITYVPMLILVALRHAEREGLAVRGMGLLLAAGALLTMYCTARIYTSVSTVAAWRLPQVLPGFMLLALASGGAWFWLILSLQDRFEVSADSHAGWLTGLLLLIAATAWLMRAYWRSLDQSEARAKTASATSLDHFGGVPAVAIPHRDTDYLMQERGFVMARIHRPKLRQIVLVLGFLLPLTLIGAAILIEVATPWAATLAVFSLMCGLFMERWLFFAGARPQVVVYYPDHP